MFSCRSLATACASRSRRALESGSPARCWWRILIATSRLRVSSCARYTTAMPPWPTSSMSLYRSGTPAFSIRHPDERVIGPSYSRDITRSCWAAASGETLARLSGERYYSHTSIAREAGLPSRLVGVDAPGLDRMGQEEGEGHAHEVELGVELLADPFGDRDCDVHDGEGGVHPHPVAAQDPQHVEQDLTDLDLAQAIPPVAADELDDRRPVALEGLGIARLDGALRHPVHDVGHGVAVALGPGGEEPGEPFAVRLVEIADQPEIQQRQLVVGGDEDVSGVEIGVYEPVL